MRRTEYMTELRQDVTFAVRQLLRNPGFTLAAVVTLALGIGATTAIFSAVKSVVLQPLPFPAPERIVAVYEDLRGNRSNVSAGNFVDGIEPVQAFAATAAMQFSSFNMSGHGDAQRVVGARVTAGFFRVFDMAPERGRVFTAEEDQPGREQVVVLSHRLWRERFAGDPGVVGRQVTLNERAYDVIGVMPARFDYTADGEELWVPIAFTPERRAMHDEHYLAAYGAPEAEATLAAAAGELAQHRGTSARRLPARERRPPVHDDAGAGRTGRRLHGAHVHAARRCRLRAAHRLRQRRQPAAGARRRPRQRDRGPRRARRRARTDCAPAPDGERGAGAGSQPSPASPWPRSRSRRSSPPRRRECRAWSRRRSTRWCSASRCCWRSAARWSSASRRRCAHRGRTCTCALRQGGRSAGMGALRDGLRHDDDRGGAGGGAGPARRRRAPDSQLTRAAAHAQRIRSRRRPLGTARAAGRVVRGSPERSSTSSNGWRSRRGRFPASRAAGITTQVPMGPGGNGNGLLREGLALRGQESDPEPTPHGHAGVLRGDAASRS